MAKKKLKKENKKVVNMEEVKVDVAKRYEELTEKMREAKARGDMDEYTLLILERRKLII